MQLLPVNMRDEETEETETDCPDENTERHLDPVYDRFRHGFAH